MRNWITMYFLARAVPATQATERRSDAATKGQDFARAMKNLMPCGTPPQALPAASAAPPTSSDARHHLDFDAAGVVTELVVEEHEPVTQEARGQELAANVFLTS